MPRDFYINGPTMVAVVGPAGSAIASATQLGLASEAIRVTLREHSESLTVDAYGKNNPVDEQVFGGEAQIEMLLIHFSPVILAEVVRLAFAGSPAEGALGFPGQRRGNNKVVGAVGSSMINLNLSSPVVGLPYNFPTAWVADYPVIMPLGTEKSIARVTWKAIAYSQDPWNGGVGSQGAILYNRVVINNPIEV